MTPFEKEWYKIIDDIPNALRKLENKIDILEIQIEKLESYIKQNREKR